MWNLTHNDHECPYKKEVDIIKKYQTEYMGQTEEWFKLLQENQQLKQKLEKIKEFLYSHTSENDPIRSLFDKILEENE